MNEKRSKRDVEFSTYRRGKGSSDESNNPGNDIYKSILASMNNSGETDSGEKEKNGD